MSNLQTCKQCDFKCHDYAYMAQHVTEKHSNDPTSAAYEDLDAIIDKAINWQGFYSEAMQLLPEDTRQFVDTTSWAGELHTAKRKELIRAALIEWREQAIVEAETRGRIDELDKLDTQYWNDDDTDVIVDMYVSKYINERKAELQANADGANGRDGEDLSNES